MFLKPFTNAKAASLGAAVDGEKQFGVECIRELVRFLRLMFGSGRVRGT